MTVERTPSLADIIRQAIEDRLADVHTMLPGRIASYDSGTQKADVEPLIKRLQQTVDGELSEELPVIPGVPVMFPRTRNYKLTMPVEPGDRCMLVFCEASTDAYQLGDSRQGSSALIRQTDPDTFDRFNLTDAVALVGWYNDYEALSASDQDGMQLGRDGGAIIHIAPDLVELYEKGASEFVALADKVETELKKITAMTDALWPILAGPAIINEPGNGAPSALQAATIIALGAVIQPSITKPAASKVKAT